ncbi:MAG: response regulator, partial [Alphaproteobacteria bacterium]|nr:response regulator [Alphaproteobacteria bacterium]
PDIQNLLAEHLRAGGHTVMTADDGAHAVGVAMRRQPDLILLDIDMPVLDGRGAMTVFKKDPLMAHIPVVVITAHGDPESRAAMERAGCDSFMTKPFDMTALDAVVNKTLDAAAA